jgi:hypothetical protein
MEQSPLIGSRRCVCTAGALGGATVLKATMSRGSASQVYGCQSGVTGSVWVVGVPRRSPRSSCRVV